MVYRTSKDTELRKEARKEHILLVAAKIFATKGFYSTSVRDIVEEAKISVGSFYFYFKNKEEVFYTLYDDMVGKILSTMQNTIDDESLKEYEKVCKAIYLILHTINSNRELSKIMLIEAVALKPDLENQRIGNINTVLNEVEKNLKNSKDKGIIDFPDTRIAALSYVGAIFSNIISWIDNDRGISLLESTFPLVIFVLQGLKIDFEKENIIGFIEKLNQENIRKGGTI